MGIFTNLAQFIEAASVRQSVESDPSDPDPLILSLGVSSFGELKGYRKTDSVLPMTIPR